MTISKVKVGDTGAWQVGMLLYYGTLVRSGIDTSSVVAVDGNTSTITVSSHTPKPALLMLLYKVGIIRPTRW